MTAPRTRDARIARIAERQHGLITRAQLVDVVGMTGPAISKRVQAGRLHRVHRGVYAVGHGALSRAGHWLAAVLVAGDGAAISHLTAAVHWGIWRREGSVATHVTAPRRVRGIPSVTWHISHTLRPRQVLRRFDVPVTNVPRTVLDLGDTLTPWQLAHVLHEAEFRDRLRLRSLERLLAGTTGRGAVTVVRRALDIRAGGSQGTKSALEDDFLSRALRRGLCPEVNVGLQLPDGTLWPDFLWRSIKVIVEVDHGHHDRVRTRREDLGRDARFRAAGYQVLRARAHSFDVTLDRVQALLAAA